MRRTLTSLLAIGSIAGLASGQARTPVAIKVAPSDVPRGYSILGDSPITPPGYSPHGTIATREEPQIRASLPPAKTMAYGAAAGFEGRLYTFGWNSSTGSPDETWVFDPAGSSWKQVASSPTRIVDAGAAVANGRIYLLSAFFPSNFSLLEYDPLTDSWTKRASPGKLRAAFAMAAANDRIYVFGGSGFPSGILDDVEEYDPVTDSWRARARLLSPRSSCAAAAVGDRLFVIGGSDANSQPLSTCDEYDLSADRWTARATLDLPRSGAAVAAAGGRVICAGGFAGVASGPVYPEFVEEYDPATDRWTTTGRITPRDGAVAATVGDAVHVVAGNLHPASGVVPLDAHVELRPTARFYVFRKE